MRKITKKIVCIILMITVTFYTNAANLNGFVAEASNKTRNSYLVVVNKTEAMKLKNEYNGEYVNCCRKDKLTEKNKVLLVELNSEEAKALCNNNEINYIEKEVEVHASHNSKNYKKNSLNKKWNYNIINYNFKKKNKDEKIKVAVLDSGVDLGNDIDVEESINLVSDEENSPVFQDITGHGSSVAGIIAAKKNDYGIEGLNPNVELYSAKILDNTNKAPISRVVNGIYWAIDKGVKIINISFGTTKDSIVLHKAIKDAYDSGILIVAAAGNTGSEVEYPAAYKEVMAVGSVNSKGEISDYSAKGEEVEILAPGEKIHSTGGFGGVLVSSGTSLAVPHVVAAASLIWEKDLTVSNEFIRQLLLECANKTVCGKGSGEGILDISYAMEMYEEYKKEYKDAEINHCKVIKNVSELTTREVDDSVEGSWSYSDHNSMVENSQLSSQEISIIKSGAVYPDSSLSGVSGLTAHPEWHGGYKADNYVGSYLYVTYLAKAIREEVSLSSVYVPGNIGVSEASYLLNAVQNVDWATMLATPSNHNKSLFVLGMALHTATDTYAHSVWAYVKHGNKNVWEHLDHGDKNGWADASDKCRERFETATAVSKKSIKTFLSNSRGDCRDYDPDTGYKNAGSTWKVRGLSDNMRNNVGCDSPTFYTLLNFTEQPKYMTYK